MLIIDQKATKEYQALSRFHVDKFAENFFDEFGRFQGGRELEGVPVGRKVGERHGVDVELEEGLIVLKPPMKAVVLKKGQRFRSVILPICGRAK